MPAGRPTDYTPEIVTKAELYLTDWVQHDSIPSVVGLCKYIGISRACVNRWGTEEDKKIFKDILDRINEEQQLVLINKGLDNTFNSAITKLVLGKHGFHEKTDQKLSGAIGVVDLTDKTDEELKQIIKGE